MATTRSYLPLLDPLRILASVAVVWVHMRREQMTSIGFGLMLFLVIMFALGSSSTRSERLSSFARRKFAWLLVPWIRWSGIYVVVAVVSATLRGLDPRAGLDPRMIFSGGHPSLWFLPFAACAIVVVRALQRVADRFGVVAVVVTCSVLAVGATQLAMVGLTLPLHDMPARAWMRAAPAILWGVAVGQTLREGAMERRRLLLLGISVLAVSNAGWSPQLEPPDDLGRRFAVATPLVCLGLAWRPRVPRVFRWLGTVTFGVYLAHPLVGKILATCFDVFSWPAALHVGAVWVGAAGTVLMLRRVPVRWHECWGRKVVLPLEPAPTHRPGSASASG